MTQLKKRSQKRAGFTLFHQVLIIALFPIVILSATTWVHESLKMTNRFKHRRESHVAMNHLANQIQDDVRACKSVKLISEENQVELTGHDGRKITFQIHEDDIHKVVKVDGEVVRREDFRLSAEYFAEWNTNTDPDAVALNIFRHPPPLHGSTPDSLQVPEPKLEFVITARSNRWQRTVVFGGETQTGANE